MTVRFKCLFSECVWLCSGCRSFSSFQSLEAIRGTQFDLSMICTSGLIMLHSAFILIDELVFGTLTAPLKSIHSASVTVRLHVIHIHSLNKATVVQFFCYYYYSVYIYNRINLFLCFCLGPVTCEMNFHPSLSSS